jgi:anti-sigma B factor antagonist
MTLRMNPVTVKQVPESISIRQGRLFFSELESSMNIDRPCVVLDCSKIKRMDKSVAHLLLCCLEEAIKRNGDVKLAGISTGVRAVFELAGLDRLFEVYDTQAEAMKSFRRLGVDPASHLMETVGAHQRSENAA